jgi:hypothetical protein
MSRRSPWPEPAARPEPERREIRKISSRPPPRLIDDQRGSGDDSRDAARLGGSCRSPTILRASFSNCRSSLKGRSGLAERPGDRSFRSDTRRTCEPPLYATIKPRTVRLVTWKQQPAAEACAFRRPCFARVYAALDAPRLSAPPASSCLAARRAAVFWR